MKHLSYHLSKALFGVILFILVACEANAQFVAPTWLNPSDNVKIIPSTSVIYKSSGTSNYDAGARSAEIIPSGGNGIVQVRMTSQNYSAGLRAFGLASSDPNYNYTSINYAFLYNGSTFEAKAYASGQLLSTTRIKEGDILKVEKVGTKILFKINNTTVATKSNVPNNVPYFIDTSILNVFGHWDDIVCNFPISEGLGWQTLSKFTLNGTTLYKNGTNVSTAVADNVIRPGESGTFWYANEIPSAHQGSFAIGFCRNPDVVDPMNWVSSIKFDATCSNIECIIDQAKLQSPIKPKDIVSMHYEGDRIQIQLNGTTILTQTLVAESPLILTIVSGVGTGDPIETRFLKANFRRNSFAFADESEISATSGDVKIQYTGITGTMKYVWSNTAYTPSSWATELSNMPIELKDEFGALTFDETFNTNSSTSTFYDVGAGKAWLMEASTYAIYPVDYMINYSSDVLVNNGYKFNNNMLSKIQGNSGNQFLLANGWIDEQNDGYVEYQVIDPCTGGVRFGLSQVGATYNSLGQHITNCFYSNNGSLSVFLNGVQTTLLGRVMRGDVLAIDITGNKIEFKVNGILLHSGNLPAGTLWQLESMYIASSSSNALMYKKLTLDNITHQKKPRPIVTHANCNGGLGKVTFKAAPCLFGSVTYTLNSMETNYSATNNTGIFDNLPPGEYSLTYTGFGCGFGMSFIISIGYYVDWSQLSNGIQYTPGPTYELMNIAPNNYETATSNTSVAMPQEGWIEWEENPVSLGSTRVAAMSTESNDHVRMTTYYSIGNVYRGSYPAGCWALMPGVFPTGSTANKTFRIKWNGNNMFFKAGDVTASCTYAFDPEVIKAVVRMSGSGSQKVIKARTSFDCASLPVVAQVKRQLDSDFYRADNGSIVFKYIEEYSDTDNLLEYKIYPVTDSGDNPVLTQNDQNLNVVLGINYHEIQLSGIQPGYYILEVENEKQEKFYLRFQKV